MLKTEPRFVMPLIPAEVDSVMAGSPAAGIGLQKGDRIVGLNGVDIDSYNTFTDQIGRLEDIMTSAKTADDSLKVRTVKLVIAREGLATTSAESVAVATTVLDTMAVTLTPDLKVGFFVKGPFTGLYEPVTKTYSFLESFPAGVKYGWNVLAGYVGDMKYVFTADGAKSLGGFGAIGSLFPPVWDWYLFWKMTAFLSIILAFMNILPIPALDGGHVLFLLYEMITRRKPSETFMIRAEYVGFGILILLMVVANLNDILRWLGYM
jgi:regulator of sigma E protease